MTEAQKKAYILADNRLAELAGWDEDILKIELEELRALDFNIDITGFLETISTLAMRLDQRSRKTLRVILPKQPKSKRGVIYQLSAHRLLCGDSTLAADWDLLMSGEGCACSY